MPLGFLAIAIQAVLLAYAYPFLAKSVGMLQSGLRFAVVFSRVSGGPTRGRRLGRRNTVSKLWRLRGRPVIERLRPRARA